MDHEQEFTSEVLKGGFKETVEGMERIKGKMKKNEVSDFLTQARERQAHRDALKLAERIVPEEEVDWDDVPQQDDKEREPTFGTSIPEPEQVSVGTGPVNEQEINTGFARHVTELVLNNILSTMEGGGVGTVGEAMTNLLRQEFEPIKAWVAGIEQRVSRYEKRLERSESLLNAMADKMDKMANDFGSAAQDMRDAASELKKKAAMNSGVVSPSIRSAILHDISHVAYAAKAYANNEKIAIAEPVSSEFFPAFKM